MHFGFVFPAFDANMALDYAIEAEKAGWDGFFVSEPVWGIDAWVTLTAIAMRTQYIRLGTMLSPISRMRPWKLASETVTLDHLSGGRVILSVGLGALDTGFEAFGEVTDRKTRAELMDEGLEILNGLWMGRPFTYTGKHYKIRESSFFLPPPPLQKPRIPVWVVGAWPYPKSMNRVLRWDGLIPMKIVPGEQFASISPKDIAEMKAYIDQRRRVDTPFDYIMEGSTPGENPQQADATVRPYMQAGITWWLEAMWQAPSLDPVLERIRQGPPRLS
jgi:Luciferase-like monooxygenase